MVERQGGECVYFTWNIQNIREIYFYVAGQSLLWASAPPGGWLRDCPDAAGDVVYTVVATVMGQSFQAQRTVRVGSR